MSSPKDVIEEEGDRFIQDYLDIDKIATSKNPYQEFLAQIESNFGKNKGINLWNKVFNKYYLLNKLFKNDLIQDKIKGSLKKAELRAFLKKLNEKAGKIEKKKQAIKKIQVKSYLRQKRRIKSFKKSYNSYNFRQERFILARKNYGLNRLAYEFNEAFKTRFSKIGIRDKRARLFRRKK